MSNVKPKGKLNPASTTPKAHNKPETNTEQARTNLREVFKQKSSKETNTSEQV